MTEKQITEISDLLEEKYCDYSQSSGKFYDQITDLWESIFKLASYKLMCLKPSFFEKKE